MQLAWHKHFLGTVVDIPILRAGLMIVMQYHLVERVWERVGKLLANSSLKLLWLHSCFLCPHSHNPLSHRKPWIYTKSQRKHRSKCAKGLFSWISVAIKCLVSCFTAKLKMVPVATGLTWLACTTCKKSKEHTFPECRTHINCTVCVILLWNLTSKTLCQLWWNTNCCLSQVSGWSCVLVFLSCICRCTLTYRWQGHPEPCVIWHCGRDTLMPPSPSQQLPDNSLPVFSCLIKRA